MRRSSDVNATAEPNMSGKPEISPKEIKAYRWNLIALAVVVISAVLVLLVPTGSSVEVSVVQDELGARTETVTKDSVSLLENEGPSVLILMAIPVLLVAVPLILPVARRQQARVFVTGLMGVFIVLGMMSIGVFFIPTLTVMMISVLVNRSKTPRF
ncbi:MAG: hypothetical protein WC184_07190 [Acidimicrobiia bacterium]